MRTGYDEMIDEMVKDLWSAEDAEDEKTCARYCREMNRKIRTSIRVFGKTEEEVRRDIMEAAWG